MGENCLKAQQCFHQLLVQKIQLDVYKQKEKIFKRKSLYTSLPDFQSFTRDVESLSWTIEFLDKREKILHIVNSNEQANFEAGFSVVWHSFCDLNEHELEDMTSLRVYAQLPICLDMKTGKLVFKQKSHTGLSLKWRRALITQIDNFSLKNVKNLAGDQKSKVDIKQILEDKLIKLFQVDQRFLFGFWNSKSKAAPLNVNIF